MAESEDARPQVQPKYQYPFAASPDIIRANQKDAYFQGVMLEHLSTLLRQIKGSRFAHSYTTEARSLADILYLSLTTLVGNRTLGEEYCDIVQVEDDTLRLPDVGLRGIYILTSILVPYALNRILPGFRRRLRAKLETTLSKGRRNDPGVAKSPSSSSSSAVSTRDRLRTAQEYILTHLDTITSPAPIHAVSLAVFYFTGAYYHISKRFLGLRYIFTRDSSSSASSSDQRVGYEVLGVLLVLQLSVQAYLHLRTTFSASAREAEGGAAPPVPANAASATGTSATLHGTGVEVSLDPNAYSSNNTLLFESGDGSVGTHHGVADKLARITHTEVRPEGSARYDLADRDTMQWLHGKQARKCTLCLEPMKDPSATTCGHVFCWTCICDWVREKPECPLCRQACLVQHILPLRG